MKKILAILFAMVMMVGTAHAYKPVDYVTGSVTNSDVDVNGTKIDSTTGFSVGAGKNIHNKWLALEGTYSQTGEIEVGGNDVGEVKTIGVWIVADPTIIKINTMPLKFLARVGGVYNNVNVHNGQNAYDTGIAWGAGVGLGVTKHLDVILDYRTMDIDTPISGVDVGVDTVGLGLVYNF